MPRTLDPIGSGSPSATAGSSRLVGEELVEKGRHGPLPGNECIGSQLDEWLEREAALVEVRVGHDETGLLDDPLVVQQEVEIDRSRAPSLAALAPVATEASLDVQKDVEEHARIEAGVDRDGAVQERRLLHGPPWVGLAQCRHRRHGDAVHLVEVPDGSADRRLAVAEVRPEPYVRTHAPTVAVRCGARARNTALIRIPWSSHETPRAWGLLPVLLSTSTRRIALAIGFLGLALAATQVAAAAAPATGPATLVQLTPAADRTEAVALTRAGANRVDAALRLWRLEPSLATRALPTLRAHHALVFAQKERTYTVATTADTTTPDPLQPGEWWLSQIGVSGLTPPGPGVPVTIVDSGLDVGHAEFLGRPDTITLNPQEPAPLGGEHGTMVASVIAAPTNGVGVVGIYPRAILRSWDAAKGDGTQLESSEIAGGILAAARAGRSVINLSLGSDASDLSIDLAVSEAVASGSLVVAASGNDGDRGSPLGYPAAYPHVTTVAATDSRGAITSFSSRSNYVDLSAPGADIIVASALGNDWRPESGTSFSSPMVAAAAAWVWTARPDLNAGQVAEILRRSATDIAPAGRDSSSGFGMLNVAAALALPTPVRDLYEPNDDIDEVDPNANDYLSKQPALTTATKRSSRVAGRIDRYEDPQDVYRVWLPARVRVTATLTASTDGDLALYSTAARTVVGRFAKDGRLGLATTKGTHERLVFANTGKGRWGYVVVKPGVRALDASYSLAMGSAKIPAAAR